MKKTGRYRHGLSRSIFNSKWYGIVQRCNNRKSIGFSRYGGRGIRCEWKSFDEFINDMYSSYKEHVKIFGERNTTIDRINPNGNYSKENCRWATFSEQNFNKGNTTMVKFEGKIMPVTEWARVRGLNPAMVFNRINRGWSLEKAISTPDTHGKHVHSI